jgi:hypothetical protein
MKRVYAPVGALATLIALVGFWPTYFGPLLSGTLQKGPIIHLHAVVYSGWLALFITQAVLAARGRIALHMKFGRIGMLYGVLVIILGLATAFSQFGTRIEAANLAEAQRALFGPFTDMLVFAPFLAAAWIYRRKPEIHKRLITVATTMLLIAAVSRMPPFRDGLTVSDYPLYLVVWLSPIYSAMLYDWFKHRIVHPVYLLGIVTLALIRLRTPLRDSETWLSISGWFAKFYT